MCPPRYSTPYANGLRLPHDLRIYLSALAGHASEDQTPNDRVRHGLAILRNQRSEGKGSVHSRPRLQSAPAMARLTPGSVCS